MFALDVQALAVGLGSIVVAFVAVIVFACIQAAGRADRYLESVAGQFGFPPASLNPRQGAAPRQPGRSIAIRIGDGSQTRHLVFPQKFGDSASHPRGVLPFSSATFGATGECCAVGIDPPSGMRADTQRAH